MSLKQGDLAPAAWGTAAPQPPHEEPQEATLVSSGSDPDGNGWMLQEITTRLPGR